MGKKAIGLSIAAVAVMMVLLLIALVVANRRASAVLESRIDELRRAGEPTSLADLAPQGVPGDENAAVLLARAKTATGAAAVELVLRAAEVGAYAPLHDYRQAPEAFLEQHLKAVQDNRVATRILQAHAMSQLQEGRPDEALESCLALLRLARHLDREPGVVSYMVALAVRSLAIDAAAKILYAGEITADRRTVLERQLAMDALMPGFVECLRSERAMGLSRFQELPATLPPWRFTHDALDYLDWMAKEIDWGATPVYELQERIKLRQQSSKLGFLTQMVLPSLDAQREAVNRVRASINALRVLNALQQHKADGTKAPDLLELGLPAEAIVDPYTGLSLVVKYSEAGWTVYSVGKNLTDDGGAVEQQLDVGVAPLPRIEE